jgi:hypothetical protein
LGRRRQGRFVVSLNTKKSLPKLFAWTKPRVRNPRRMLKNKPNIKAEAFLNSFFKVKLKKNGLRTVKYRTQPSANYKSTGLFQN